MKRSHTRAQRALYASVLATSDVCYICGKPGADAVDHVRPWVECKRLGIDPDELSNLRPAHHDVEPKCNRRKSDKQYAPIVRRSGSLS